jgi:hypothetical protein
MLMEAYMGVSFIFPDPEKRLINLGTILELNNRLFSDWQTEL